MIPADYEKFLALSPAQIQQLCDELTGRPLDTSSIEQWLRDYTDLSCLFQECGARFDTSAAVNTTDQAAQQRLTDYRQNIEPISRNMEQAVEAQLQAHVDLLPDALRQARTQQAAVMRINSSDAAIELLNRERAIIGRYEAIRGAQTVMWDGEEIPARRLNAVMQGADREQRERATRVSNERAWQDRDTINALWSELIDIRVKQAEVNGFDDYLAYQWALMQRHDYTPADSARLHDIVYKHWSPLMASLMAQQKERLQVDVLRPWDIAAAGRALRPFTTTADLMQKTVRVFERLDPEFGQYVVSLRDRGFIDLAERSHTGSTGGFSRAIGRNGNFIFLNVKGTREDAESLIHELGHAVSLYATARQPYSFFFGFPADFSETPSGIMEMLTQPYWDEYYNPDDVKIARRQYFRTVIHGGLDVASFDAFQHRVYRHPNEARQPGTCDAWWHELLSRNVPGVDWSGQEAMNGMNWQRMGLNFYGPLYGMEYFYGHMAGLHLLTLPPSEALARYKTANAMGSSVSPRVLFGALGVDFPFTEAAVQAAAAMLAERIAE